MRVLRQANDGDLRAALLPFLERHAH
jgi:hypothetical protein